MSSDCDGTTVTANPTAPTTAKDQRLNIDGLNLKKLDALQEVVIKRLGGGGFGDWWIEGHKTSSDTRHHALQEVFQLKRAIEDLNTTLLQQGRAPQLLDREIKANSKAAIIMNAKTREMIEGLVDKRMEEKMRDVGLNMGRTMDEARVASQKENKDLRETIKSLEVKNKKNCDAVATSNTQEIRAVKKSIEELKRQNEAAQAAGEEKFLTVEQGQALSKKSLSASRKLGQRLDGELDTLRADLQAAQAATEDADRFTQWILETSSLDATYAYDCFEYIQKRIGGTFPEPIPYP